jgi:precorrin-2 methylase
MEGTKQEVKRFLTEKAMEFIKKSQVVPCSRKSRRQAARDIAKRYLKTIRAEEAQNANV